MSDPDQYPFQQVKNLAVITLGRILRREISVLYVTHDEDDGGWQFLADEIVDVADAVVIGLGEMFLHDPSIGKLADLPIGWTARRPNAYSQWDRQTKAARNPP